MSNNGDKNNNDANVDSPVTVRRRSQRPQNDAVQETLQQLDQPLLTPEEEEQIRIETEKAKGSIAAALAAHEADRVRQNQAARAVQDAKAKFKHFLDTRIDNILPNLPSDDPIYSYAWVPYDDSINKVDNLRTRLASGWYPVKIGEIDGWQQNVMNTRSAQFGEYVTYQELVAVRIERAFRELYLKHFHHDMPNQMEGQLREEIAGKLQHDEYGSLVHSDRSSEFDKYGRRNVKPNFNGV